MKRALLFVGLLVASACTYGQSIYDKALTCKYEAAPPPVVQFTITCAPAQGPGTPVQPPPVEKPPAPPADDPCAQYVGNFLLYSYCQQGVARPDPAGIPPDGSYIQTTGFVLERRSSPYRNYLVSGVPYRYSAETAPYENVTFTILEVPGTPDSMFTSSYVIGPGGEILSKEVMFMRHGNHNFVSPGGVVTMVLTPTDSGHLGVQRN
jgi:hypothetical protein